MRANSYDADDIVFSNRNNIDNADCTMSDEKMRMRTSAGNVSCIGSISSNSVSLSNACIVAGNVGIKNESPWGDLNVGNCAVVGFSGHAVYGKNNGAGNRNFKQGISSNFVLHWRLCEP